MGSQSAAPGLCEVRLADCGDRVSDRPTSRQWTGSNGTTKRNSMTPAWFAWVRIGRIVCRPGADTNHQGNFRCQPSGSGTIRKQRVAPSHNKKHMYQTIMTAVQHLAAASELRLSTRTLFSRNMAASCPRFSPMRTMIHPFSLSSTLQRTARQPAVLAHSGTGVSTGPTACTTCPSTAQAGPA